MDSALLTPVEILPAEADLAPLLVRVLAEMDQLRAEMTMLRRENLELRQQAGYWKSRHSDAVQRLTAAQQEIEQLRGEIRKLQAEQFGRRSEKQSTSDRSNELDDPSSTEPKRRRGRQPGQPA